MFEKFSESARRVLFHARYEASRLGSSSIRSEHLLLGILCESGEIIQELLSRCRVSPKTLQEEVEAMSARDDAGGPEEIYLAGEVKRTLALSVEEAKKLFHNYIGPEHLLLGLLRNKECAAGRLLYRKEMDLYSAREDLISILQRRILSRKKKNRPLLNEFSRNLNHLARQDAFDPLIGRDSEIDRIIQVLSRRRKNNPVLIGEPGVGKTAIVEGLTRRINTGEIPSSLATKQILALDLGLIVAGTKYRGQFEERLKGILKEIVDNQDIIVFIDEIHTLIGAGSAEGSLDAASILKPALSRGEIQCIGATTVRDYHRYIERDRALVRRFQPIKVDPPSVSDTLDILHGVKGRYERFHRVRYTDASLESAARSSDRYITDRSLPDKAIDVMDEAGARVKLRHTRERQEVAEAEALMHDIADSLTRTMEDGRRRTQEAPPEEPLDEDLASLRERYDEEFRKILTVDRADVDAVISTWTGVPVSAIKKREGERLLQIEEYMHTRIVGQEKAISALARTIRRCRSGISNPNRPSGSFLFLGPTGVGKTETAKTVAQFLFHDPRALVRLDMSEYMEKHAVAKMIGSPPGYIGHEEGGTLTNQIKRSPYSVILLDEIEKAHADALNILLQVLEDGHITDSFGDRVDFKNCLLIMTSNIGSRELDGRKVAGFQRESFDGPNWKDHERLVTREARRVLSPEFLNRIDEVITFHPLAEEHLVSIARLMASDLVLRLAEHGMQLEFDEEVYTWLVERCCADRRYGARPLRRGIQRHIEDVISERLIAEGEPIEERLLRISCRGEELLFESEKEPFAAGVT